VEISVAFAGSAFAEVPTDPVEVVLDVVVGEEVEPVEVLIVVVEVVLST
jgi:hypothetical protein